MRTLNRLLTFIVNDDGALVGELIRADATLATRLVVQAKLYEAKIFHWLYVGDTALHLAAAGYRVEIVKRLIAAGADPNGAMNHRCSTPLHYAADGYITGPNWDARRQVKTIGALLDAGADIQAPDKNGATPLHRAVRTRCAAAVKFLLKRGADPTLKNKPGSTPFHLAVQNTGRGGSGAEEAKTAQREIIAAFRALGVSTSLLDGKGKSVLASARSGWVQELLRGKSHGIEPSS